MHHGLGVAFVRGADRPLIALIHGIEWRHMEGFVMWLEIIQIQQVVVALVPRCIAHFCQHVLTLAVSIQEVQVQWTEIQTQVTQLSKQVNFTAGTGLTAEFRNLHTHRGLKGLTIRAQVIFPSKSRPMPPTCSENPDSFGQAGDFGNLEQNHEQGIAEFVMLGGKPPMADKSPINRAA